MKKFLTFLIFLALIPMLYSCKAKTLYQPGKEKNINGIIYQCVELDIIDGKLSSNNDIYNQYYAYNSTLESKVKQIDGFFNNYNKTEYSYLTQNMRLTNTNGILNSEAAVILTQDVLPEEFYEVKKGFFIKNFEYYNSSEMEIPASIDGYPVFGIGNDALNGIKLHKLSILSDESLSTFIIMPDGLKNARIEELSIDRNLYVMPRGFDNSQINSLIAGDLLALDNAFYNANIQSLTFKAYLTIEKNNNIFGGAGFIYSPFYNSTIKNIYSLLDSQSCSLILLNYNLYFSTKDYLLPLLDDNTKSGVYKYIISTDFIYNINNELYSKLRIVDGVLDSKYNNDFSKEIIINGEDVSVIENTLIMEKDSIQVTLFTDIDTNYVVLL